MAYYFFAQLQGSTAVPLFVVHDPGSQTVASQCAVGLGIASVGELGSADAIEVAKTGALLAGVKRPSSRHGAYPPFATG